VKLVTIGFALAGAAVAALVVIVPAALAVVALLTSNEKSKERGKSHEK